MANSSKRGLPGLASSAGSLGFHFRSRSRRSTLTQSYVLLVPLGAKLSWASPKDLVSFRLMSCCCKASKLMFVVVAANSCWKMALRRTEEFLLSVLLRCLCSSVGQVCFGCMASNLLRPKFDRVRCMSQKLQSSTRAILSKQRCPLYQVLHLAY